MTHKLQKYKILDLLKERDWVCVEDMTKLFIVDYRRRLVDIQRMGYELESRRCTQHSYHRGGSKEWKITGRPAQQKIIQMFAQDGRPYVKEIFV